MSFTEHEVGSVPSATKTNSDPKHLNYLLVAVISFLVPLAGPHHGSPPRRPGPRLQAMTWAWRRTSSPYSHCLGAR